MPSYRIVQTDVLIIGGGGAGVRAAIAADDADASVAMLVKGQVAHSGLTAMAYAYVQSKKWDVSFTVNGFLAGLVAITCPCYWVSPTGSILLGGVAGVIVVLGVELLEWLRIDDPIGAVPVHGFCGIWGTLSLGLFACGQYGATGPTAPDNTAPLTVLFYGGGTTVLAAQAIGSLIITASTFAVALAVMYAVKATGLLRVSAGGETYGLDLHEHGISAYPEYVISSVARPVGLAGEGPAPAAGVLSAEPMTRTIVSEPGLL